MSFGELMGLFDNSDIVDITLENTTTDALLILSGYPLLPGPTNAKKLSELGISLTEFYEEYSDTTSILYLYIETVYPEDTQPKILATAIQDPGSGVVIPGAPSPVVPYNELVLIPEQLTVSGILEAGFIRLSANPSNGDTITFKDKDITTVYTFKNTPVNPNDVLIAGTPILTAAQLEAVIIVNDVTWSAVHIASTADLVIMRQVKNSTNYIDRFFSTTVVPGLIKYINFGSKADYSSEFLENVPTTDLGAKYFGFGRLPANFRIVERHDVRFSPGDQYYWDEVSWQLAGGGGGEVNTGTNVNTSGESVFLDKVGVALRFKGIDAGSTKISTASNETNKTIEIDIVESNLDHVQDSTIHFELDDITASSSKTYSSSKIDTLINDVALSFSGKAHVEVVTQGLGPVTASGLQTLHGYTLLDGDRVARTEEVDPKDNGVFDAHSGAWTRSTDFDGTPNGEVKAGTFFFVSENDNTYAGYRFFITGNDTNIDVGTDPINFDFNAPSVPAEVVKTNQANTYSDFNQLFRSGRLKVMNPANTFSFSFVGSAITANRDITIPLLTGNDTLAFLGAGQTFTNKTYQYPETLDTDLTAIGKIKVHTFGENFSFGETGYLKSDGKVWKADATAASKHAVAVMCVESGGVLADAAGKALYEGVARDDSWSFTVGSDDLIYQSKTAGELTQNVSGYVVGDLIQVVAYAFPNANTVYFNPSPDHIIHN